MHNLNKLTKEAKEYYLKLYPCIDPCDSYGVCDGCAEGINFLAGYEFGEKANKEKIEILTKALGYFSTDLWNKPELQGMWFPDAVLELQNKAIKALEKVK